MISTLAGLLPSGGTVSQQIGHGSAPAEPDGVTPSAALTYTTAAGTSSIDVTIGRLEPGVPRGLQGQGNCLPADLRPYDSCTSEDLPDGAQLTTVESFTDPAHNTGQKRWYVVCTTRAGVQVVAEEYGGGREKATGSPAVPLLSTGRLAAIAQSPAWKAAIASVPTPVVHKGKVFRTDNPDAVYG